LKIYEIYQQRIVICLILIFALCGCSNFPIGADFSDGTKKNDLLIVVSDVELIHATHNKDGKYNKFKNIHITPPSFHVKPAYCHLIFSSNETLIPKNTLLYVSEVSGVNHTIQEKISGPVRYSGVGLRASSKDQQYALVMRCQPEEVLRIGFWVNSESNNRMMSVEEVQLMVKEFLKFNAGVNR
jgi:hypothetical protein